MAIERQTRAAAHAATIADQFTRQAAQFSAAPALHNEAALNLLVDVSRPQAEDRVLDVACGPGSVVAAFAPKVFRAVGLDATGAMLDEARKLAARKGLANVAWYRGDVYALPFGDGTFDIVSCRFAFHHFRQPSRAFAEMVRVCRPGGRVVLCDAYASDDPVKAAAFNAMERYRDPSTVEFRPLGYLRGLYEGAGLDAPGETYYAVPAERDRVVAISYPVDDDRAGLRRMIDASVEDDLMGLDARREGETVRFSYSSVILVGRRG